MYREVTMLRNMDRKRVISSAINNVVYGINLERPVGICQIHTHTHTFTALVGAINPGEQDLKLK